MFKENFDCRKLIRFSDHKLEQKLQSQNHFRLFLTKSLGEETISETNLFIIPNAAESIEINFENNAFNLV